MSQQVDSNQQRGHLRASVTFRAPLIDGKFFGLPWLPALQFYADLILDELALVFEEWVAQGWRPDFADLQKQLSKPAGKLPPVEYLGEIPTVTIGVHFTRDY